MLIRYEALRCPNYCTFMNTWQHHHVSESRILQSYKMNLKYTIGAILTIPLLPVLYFQGKKVKTTMPELPEADGAEGISDHHSGRKLRMLAIGESSIAGVGVKHHRDGFIATLATALATKLEASISWKVYAKSGYTAKQVNTKIVPEILDKSIDLIVLGVGANDAFTLNTPKRWNKHVANLIHSVREKFGEVPVVFINMPPIKELPAFTSLMKLTLGNLVEILGTSLKRLVSSYEGVYFYDRLMTIDDWLHRLKIQATHAEFFSDGVHPSALTYQVWAKDFANFIYTHEELRIKLQQSIR